MSTTLTVESGSSDTRRMDAFIAAARPQNENDLELIRVLVADGNRTVRKILRHTFDALRWETIEAEDGEEALRLAATRPAPHAVLLDLNLRKVDGFEVCRRLKSDLQTKLIPVIALTSAQDKEETLRAVDAGADEFINKPINQAELKVRLRTLMRIHSFNRELIGAESVAMALARAVASKDGYSNSHVEAVANFAAHLADHLELDPAEAKVIRYGAILHNVGKIAIPDAVLEKTGPLSPREKALFQQHPRVGCDICAPLKPLRSVLPIIRHHKEHWDGTGYPDGLRGNDIPLGAQIVGVVDVYNALTSDRPFRKAMSHDAAVSTLRERVHQGIHNPELVESFIECLAKHQTSDASAQAGDSDQPQIEKTEAP